MYLILSQETRRIVYFLYLGISVQAALSRTIRWGCIMNKIAAGVKVQARGSNHEPNSKRRRESPLVRDCDAGKARKQPLRRALLPP